METKPTENANAPATRREFLKKTALATAAVAATRLVRPTVYGQAPSAGKVLGANDRIVLGYIGVGNQGLNIHVGYLKKSATANNLAQAAVCDVWAASVSNDSPRSEARRSAVMRTNEGSLRLPRWGSGAR